MVKTESELCGLFIKAQRKPFAHYVYAVVPQPKRPNEFLFKLFADYGIGILFIRNTHFDASAFIKNKKSSWNYIDVLLFDEKAKPRFNRTPKEIKLYDENKSQIAGVKNGGITPFAIMVKSITKFLVKRGPQKLADCFEHQIYYGKLTQFKSNIYQWCRKGVIKDFRLEKGVLILNECSRTKS